MAIMDKMLKAGTLKTSSVLSKSVYFLGKECIKTDLPILNVAFSGDLDGGLVSGITIIAGEKASYKTAISLYCMSSYLKKYDDAVAIFYDNEFGADDNYFKTFGIDTSRVIHVPVTDLEELRFDIVSRLEAIERGDHVFFLVDSVGNLASKKEYVNAVEQNSAQDMSRNRDIKGLFRIVTPHLNKKNLPFVAITHVYDTMALFSQKVVSGGCLVEGTKIKTADGLKSINELRVGELVETLDGKKEIEYVWNPSNLEDGNPECLEIEFEDGTKVTCSQSHKFLVNGKWVEAKDLQVESSVNTKTNVNMKIISIQSVGRKPVYDIMVKDAHHYILENGVVTHNSGILYSANTIFIITKAQEKSGTELAGWNFTINIEKSRFVKEKSKLKFQVLYGQGIVKYSGLLEPAMEAGVVIKPSNGWYSRVDENGVVEEKKWRIKDTFSEEFWKPILEGSKFKEFIKERYQLVNSDKTNIGVDTEVNIEEDE